MKPHLIVYGGATAERWPQHLRVTLSDGGVLHAAPQATDEYLATAQRLGYGTATRIMAAEHDQYHAWVAQMLAAGNRGEAHSPLLHGIATDTLDRVPWWQVAGEEALVAAFSRFVNTGEEAPELACLVLAGVDLKAVRLRAHELRKRTR